MIFYDFEVFKKDWLVVIEDMTEQKETVIVNEPGTLEDFYEAHKSDIWCGFNNHHYDDIILKAIICGLDPYAVSETIIRGDRFYNADVKKLHLVSYDVMNALDRGLKFFEGSMGESVVESSVDFLIDRKLTDAEIEETITYCRHDVEQTIKVFLERKADFDSAMGLIKMFPEQLSISDIGLTKAQMSAKILECERVTRNDEFDISILPSIKIEKNRNAVEFFLDEENHTYDVNYITEIGGLMHTIGWGGIHAGKEKYHNDGKHCQMWHIDVASFYPRLMIFHHLLTRNCKNPDKFKQIYDKRIELKHAGKKKEQAPLKIVINGTYGISKAPTSAAYDPRNANLICLNGQWMLIDLIEKLEAIRGFELIQSNTDGIIVAIPDTDDAFSQMDDVCYEWEKRNNMSLEFDQISEIWQKDVNNYVFRFSNGKLERKGAYVKELGSLDYNLPIVNTALVKRITEGIPLADTIGRCDELKEFQIIKKISSKYSTIVHGAKPLNERCVRCFASIDSMDGGLFKEKVETGRLSKIENTPEHCFLHNESVNGVKCPSRLDKQWYLSLAEKRLEDFGLV